MNNASKMSSLDIMRKQIDDINNKRINTNNGHYTEVYTSKENIKKELTNNYNKHWDYDEDFEIYED